MRKFTFAVLLFACFQLNAAESGKERLTFEDTSKQLRWVSSIPEAGVAWDGKHVEFGEEKAKKWLDPVTGETSDAQALPSVQDAPKMRWRAVLERGDLYIDLVPEAPPPSARRRAPGQGSAPRKLSDKAIRLTTDGTQTRKREAHVSRDGAYASFVQDGNLVIVDVQKKKQWAVTNSPVGVGGKISRFNGLLDWVYQEEIYGRGDFQGHWWSHSSGHCAYLSLDESEVKDYTLVEHVPDGFLDKERSVIPDVSSYPKSGDPNPVASLFIANAKKRKTVAVDLSAYPKDVLIVRVQWTDDERLLVTLQDRIQTWAELCVADPKSGKLTRWIREESPTWTNRPEPPRWLPDGTLFWLSERTGYQHIYHYRPGGELIKAVTNGEWQVRRIERIDPEKKVIWFEGTKDGAAGRHLYRVNFDSSGLTLLTPGDGTHEHELSPDGSFLVDRWSACERPPTVRVISGTDGKVLREIGQARKGVAEKYAFSEKKKVMISARDGYELDATVIMPTEFDKSKTYPVFLPTYSGPDAPTVRDAWSHSTYDQFLAQQGFIILQVNVRTASNRGQVHTGKCYKRVGEQELKDLEDAVNYITAHNGDPRRIAISGWSFGGFISAFALTHSSRFALGIAGAGVYDWRLYDSVYTERYMGLPDQNKDGYDATSVIKAAKNLHGHLVLIHGTMDDNVHMQNTIQLVWELQKVNKQNFELMLYPRSQHGLAREVGRHNHTFQWRALSKLLDPNFKAE